MFLSRAELQQCKRPGWSRCGPAPAPLEIRIMSAIREREDGCWEWTKGKNQGGYGQIKVRGKGMAAHRVSYQIFVGEIPDGMFVCHKCDNPSCCNPKHLFLGTATDNYHDCLSKGRWRPGSGNRSKGAQSNHAVKIDIATVKEILAMQCSNSEIARRLKIGRKVVSLIKSGRHWSLQLLDTA